MKNAKSSINFRWINVTLNYYHFVVDFGSTSYHDIAGPLTSIHQDDAGEIRADDTEVNLNTSNLAFNVDGNSIKIKLLTINIIDVK